MLRRIFGRSRQPDASAAWWTRANTVAEAVSVDAVAELRTDSDDGMSMDERERREELIDGLEQLVAVTSRPDLPILSTQHRVIGSDDCHFMTPVSLPGAAGAPGKLFLTSRRLVVASSGVKALAWHRIARLTRADRDLLAIVGNSDVVHVQCNSYGDALVAAHLSHQLMARVRQER